MQKMETKPRGWNDDFYLPVGLLVQTFWRQILKLNIGLLYWRFIFALIGRSLRSNILARIFENPFWLGSKEGHLEEGHRKVISKEGHRKVISRKVIGRSSRRRSKEGQRKVIGRSSRGRSSRGRSKEGHLEEGQRRVISRKVIGRSSRGRSNDGHRKVMSEKVISGEVIGWLSLGRS